MAEWVTPAALSVLVMAVLGVLTWRVTHRTQKTSERQDARAADEAVIARYKESGAVFHGYWLASNARLSEVEGQVGEYRAEQERMREEVRGLRAALEQMESVMGRLVAFVKHLLTEWDKANPDVKRPDVWSDIAHLIHPREKP